MNEEINPDTLWQLQVLNYLAPLKNTVLGFYFVYPPQYENIMKGVTVCCKNAKN